MLNDEDDKNQTVGRQNGQQNPAMIAIGRRAIGVSVRIVGAKEAGDARAEAVASAELDFLTHAIEPELGTMMNMALAEQRYEAEMDWEEARVMAGMSDKQLKAYNALKDTSPHAASVMLERIDSELGAGGQKQSSQ